MKHLAPALLAALLLASCAGGPPPRSLPVPAHPPAAHPPTAAPRLPGPPPSAAELAAMPDATPRFEPRSKAGNPPFYEVQGQRYFVLSSAEGYKERGVASWYGPGFHAERTSNGEPYDMYAMTAAHKTLPLPAYVRVTNLANGRSVVLRVNDRGPFVGNRIIDLSYTAAWKLDMLRAGTAFVEVEALVPGSLPTEAGVLAAPAPPPDTRVLAPPQRLYVQVGAFSVQDNARALRDRLQAAGINDVQLLAPQGGQALWRVRLGPLADAATYDARVAQLAGLGLTGRLTTD